MEVEVVMNNPDLRGAAVMRELRVIPFEAFTRMAFKVYVPDADPEKTGRIRTVEYVDSDEPVHGPGVLEIVTFLLSNLVPRPGPVHWGTVPEHVRRHFRLLDEQPAKSQIIGA